MSKAAAATQSVLSPDSFPFTLISLVDSYNPTTDIWRARRQPGELVAEASAKAAPGHVEFQLPTNAPPQASAAVALLTEALAAWPSCAESAAAASLDALELRANHRALVEAVGPRRIALDLDAASRPVLGEGAIEALAIGFIAAAHACMHGPRAGAAAALRFYRALSAQQQRRLQNTLHGQAVDSGNLCALLLERAGAPETDPQDELQWIAWFLGQSRVDLPYARTAAENLLEADMDFDERRLRIHEVISRYDRDLEEENIRRIAREVLHAKQYLIFGRMGRAFHNQVLLFANSRLVSPPDLSQPLAALSAAAQQAPALAPHVDRLRAITSTGDELPLAHAIGSIEKLEDAALDCQRTEMRRILDQDGSDDERAKLNSLVEHVLKVAAEIRAALTSSPSRPAAFSVPCQRLWPSETHILAKINGGREPYMGKPASLRALTAEAAERSYCSPDYRWLRHADHWVEAIPLFIRERVLVSDGVETTETVIDQQAMEESFREQLADHWALNLRDVTDREHIALARELAGLKPGVPSPSPDETAALAAWVAEVYNQAAPKVHELVERAHIHRMDALRSVLADPEEPTVSRLRATASQRAISLAEAAQAMLEETPEPTDAGRRLRQNKARLLPLVDEPLRQMPTVHILTTQSAGMTESYVGSWLQESIALFNVVHAHGLEAEVEERQAAYRNTINRLASRVIADLGLEDEVAETMATEGIDRVAAVLRIVAVNRRAQQDVGCLAVLLEHLGITDPDCEPDGVLDILHNERAAIEEGCCNFVFERNADDLEPRVKELEANGLDRVDAIRQLIQADGALSEELNGALRLAARRLLLQRLAKADPAAGLIPRSEQWLRDHSRLSLTTARKEVVARHGLNHLTNDPRYSFRFRGPYKRFNLLYTPSRVDLGPRERESVEKWPQWVGGADEEAALAARRLFGLINKSVKMFTSLVEPEVLKTGENASMVSHFAYSNALGLMVNYVGRGDFEEVADQWNLRHDRRVHPAGEGYGGYCVPKDGLFLEFVLALTRATKLRQLGIPEHLHAPVAALAKHVLGKRAEFELEVQWEDWAARLLADRKELEPFFGVRTTGPDSPPIPVFQVTRLARMMETLGRPEGTSSAPVLANLSANWAVRKMVVGAEQVNRFMPFYKVWLTYQAVADSRRRNGSPRDRRDFTVVLTAEYKPNTQDGRYSVGMRKYEMYAGTHDHLVRSLDAEGQDLAELMLGGFEALWRHRNDPLRRPRIERLAAALGEERLDDASAARLMERFQPCGPPAEVRIVSPVGLSTQDLMFYTSDTWISTAANGVRQRLLKLGLSEAQIRANFLTHGPRLRRWAGLRERPKSELDALVAELGGRIHALALEIVGPERTYERALQGADVFDTGIPHKEVVALLEDLPRVRDLMLYGNPDSALVIVDGASGARRRAMNRADVMAWFAAGDKVGKEAVYAAVGVGQETVEAWRAEMRRQRRRAQELMEALTAGDETLARRLYASIVEDARARQESELETEYEERMVRFGTARARDRAVSRAIVRVAGGLPLEQLTFADWLGLGGQYVVLGDSMRSIERTRRNFERALALMAGSEARPIVDEDAIAALIRPRFVPEAEEFREEKGVESSNKATEEDAEVALSTRRQLAARAAAALALRERQSACEAAYRDAQGLDFAAAFQAAIDALGRPDRAIPDDAFGSFLGYARRAADALLEAISPPDVIHRSASELLALAFSGREITELTQRKIMGGYEDPGDIARLDGVLVDRHRAGEIGADQLRGGLLDLTRLGELFTIALAVDRTWELHRRPPSMLQPIEVWRKLATFFAETINDHRYEYRPWLYSRGVGLSSIEGDDLYSLAVERHQWVYRYIRHLVLTCTELAEMSPQDVAALLGDIDTAEASPAIGAAGATAAERRWRAYNQLRELAFIRNDGFPLPKVFPELNPDIIRASSRTNQVLLYPVGRTHVSRMVTEGPTAAQELIAEGRPGTNIILTRDGQFVPGPGGRQVLAVSDGHLYLSAAEYVEALIAERGLSPAEAEAAAQADVGPKGVRCAVRFTKPVIASIAYPFHGHPKYDSGELEAAGLPYSVQSLFHTWTTYDKAKYPDIFKPAGVDIPDEIDWLAEYTAGLREAEAMRRIEHGHPEAGFPGLRAFATKHRVVMVKDAAESGGRNQSAFVLRRSDGSLDDGAISLAVDFIYRISLKHNVAIQEVITSSPEYWATEEFMQSFVDRQVVEWGERVERNRRPRTPVYGSHRLVLSTADPLAPAGEGKWHASHAITLNSRQLITNVGRGGTLEQFLPQCIRPEFRESLLAKLRDSAIAAIEALSAYEARGAERYKRETGREVGKDASGVSYGAARYMMMDFLLTPVFAEEGVPVDVEPVVDERGVRVGSRIILQRGEDRFEGKIVDWRAVLIEPNIGIGLWDRVALREEAHEREAAQREGRPMDWTKVGANARIVLRDMARAAEEYMQAVFGEDALSRA